MDETIYVILKLLFDFALEVWFSIYSQKRMAFHLIEIPNSFITRENDANLSAFGLAFSVSPIPMCAIHWIPFL